MSFQLPRYGLYTTPAGTKFFLTYLMHRTLVANLNEKRHVNQYHLEEERFPRYGYPTFRFVSYGLEMTSRMDSRIHNTRLFQQRPILVVQKVDLGLSRRELITLGSFLPSGIYEFSVFVP